MPPAPPKRSHRDRNPWGQAHSAFQLSKCALEAGAYAEALAHAQQGAALAHERQMPMLGLLCLDLLGVVQRTLGMLDAARATHQAAAQAVATPTLASPMAPMFALELIADDAAAGDWAAACAAARPFKDMSFDRAAPYTLMLSLGLLTETLLCAGEAEAAAALIQGSGEHTRNSPRARVAQLRASALLAQWQGDIEPAIDQLREAAALAEEIDLPGERWQIHAALGQLYHMQGDESEAQAMLEQARSTLRARRHARRRIAGGVPRGRAGAAAVGGATSRGHHDRR